MTKNTDTQKTCEPPSSGSPTPDCCASFIPAPWWVNDSAPASSAVETEKGIITRVYYSLCDSRIEMEKKEAFDTASLIAAAPDLLNALERIVNKFDAAERIEGHCICDAREAIAKARGHSQHNT
jgi:hypothetical protein